MLSVTGKGIICVDPELRFTQGGTAICRATLVNNEEYNGEKTAHFTKLILWGERAEEFAESISKGCLIEITSGILKHPVTESNGKKYYNTEVTVLEWDFIEKFENKTESKGSRSGSRGSNGSSGKSNNSGSQRGSRSS